VKPTVSLSSGHDGGRITIMVGVRMNDPLADKGVSNLVVSVKLPKSATAPKIDAKEGQAKISANNVLRWDIGRIHGSRTPSLTCVFSLPASGVDEGYDPSCMVDFKIPMVALSGLKIETVNVTNEKYNPYKGVRAVSQAGKFHIRA